MRSSCTCSPGLVRDAYILPSCLTGNLIIFSESLKTGKFKFVSFFHKSLDLFMTFVMIGLLAGEDSMAPA